MKVSKTGRVDGGWEVEIETEMGGGGEREQQVEVDRRGGRRENGRVIDHACPPGVPFMIKMVYGYFVMRLKIR